MNSPGLDSSSSLSSRPNSIRSRSVRLRGFSRALDPHLTSSSFFKGELSPSKDIQKINEIKKEIHTEYDPKKKPQCTSDI